MNKMKRRLNNKGFSFGELMLVVALTIILTTMGAVGVISYQRRLKMMEVNETAKEIFLAAQNHLTGSWANGEWESVIKTKQKTYFGTEGDIADVLTADDKHGHEFYYVSNSHTDNPDILNDIILPFGSIEEKVRTNGSYIIEYDAITATVYDVFYADGIVDITAEDAEFTINNEDDLMARIRYALQNQSRGYNSPLYIGHYGEGMVPLGPARDYIAPTVKVKDQENLWLEITDTNLLKYPDSTLTLTFTGKISHATVSVRIPVDDIASEYVPYEAVPSDELYVSDTSITQVFYESPYLAKSEKIDNTRIYYVLLDSLTFDEDISSMTGNVFGQFGKHFKNFTDKVYGEDGLAFINGEDVGVVATIYSPDTGKSAKGTAIFNNLFHGILPTEEGTGNYYALIENPRHLQNLSREASGIDYIPSEDYDGNTFNFTGATMVHDIYWEDANGYLGYMSKLPVCPESYYGDTDSFCPEWKMHYTTRYEATSDATAIALEREGLFFLPISNNRHDIQHGIGYHSKYPCFASRYPFTFDGGNNKIYNLNVYRHESDISLFAQNVNSNLIIQNLDMVDPSIGTNTRNNVGIFCGKIQQQYWDMENKSNLGESNLIIRNCHAYLSSSEEYARATYDAEVGNDLTLTQWRQGKYKGIFGTGVSVSTGGLLGDLHSGNVIIEDSSVAVPIYSHSTEKDDGGVGGLVGVVRKNSNDRSSNLVIRNSFYGGYTQPYTYSDGTPYSDYSVHSINLVADNDTYAGGLIGRVADNIDSLTLENCYSTGSVYSNYAVGGLIGYIGNNKSFATITNCYSTGRAFYDANKLTSWNRIGSFVGGATTLPNASNNIMYDYAYSDSAIDQELLELNDKNNSSISYVTYDGIAKSRREDRLSAGVTPSVAKPYAYFLGRYPYPYIESNKTIEREDGVFYYHIGDWPQGLRYIEPEIPTINNGNDLTVTFHMRASQNFASIKLTGVVSDRSKYIYMRRVGTQLYGGYGSSLVINRGDAIYSTPLKYSKVVELEDGTFECTVTLDNPVMDYGSFAYMFSRNNGLYPGEDIKVYYNNDLFDSDAITPAITNSLFAYNENKSSNSTAYISSARHLINLESDYSSINNNQFNNNGALVITAAEQISDIRWAESYAGYEKPESQAFNPYIDDVKRWLAENPSQTTMIRINGNSNRYTNVHDDFKLHPIRNYQLSYYDGNGHTLDAFDIYRVNNEMVGLFNFYNNGNIESIHDLNLKDFSVDGSSYGAGVLLGRINNRPNLRIYNIGISGNISVNSSNDNAGLIAPYVENSTISLENINVNCGTINIVGMYNVSAMIPTVNSNSTININKVNLRANSMNLQSTHTTNSVRAGGLIAQGDGNIYINDVHFNIANTMSVSSRHNAGGLIGYAAKIVSVTDTDLTAGTLNVHSEINDAAGLFANTANNNNAKTFKNVTLNATNLDVSSGVSDVSSGACAGGVFGYLGGTVIEVDNVKLISEDMNILSNSASDAAAGGFVASLANTITLKNTSLTSIDMHVNGTAIPDGKGNLGRTRYVGGYIGYAQNSINLDGVTFNVSNLIDIDSYSNAGGFAGTISREFTSTPITIRTNMLDVYTETGNGGGFFGQMNVNVARTLDDCHIVANSINVNAGTSAGGLMAYKNGAMNISNISITAPVITLNARNGSVGGVIGYNEGIVNAENLSVNGSSTIDLSSTAYGGGIFGYSASATTAENLNVYGGDVEISTNTNDAAGVIGRIAANNPNTITNSSVDVNSLNITTNNSNAGGIVGYINGTATIDNVSVSTNEGTTIHSNNWYVGGIAAQLNTGTVSSSTINGDLDISSTSKNAGGFIGYCSNRLDIDDALIDGSDLTVYGGSQSGGLIGYLQNNVLDLSSAEIFEDTISIQSNHMAAGLAGQLGNNNTHNIEYFNITAKTIDISGKSNSGGIIGEVNGPSIIGTNVDESGIYADSLSIVTTSNRAGGLIGNISKSTEIRNVVIDADTMTVSSPSNSGGFIGYANRNTVLIENSRLFSDEGLIEGNANSGGLVGEGGQLTARNSIVFGKNLLIRGNADNTDHGGFVGKLYASNSIIENSVFSGRIYCNYNRGNRGGFVGYSNGGKLLIQNSYTAGRTVEGSYSAEDYNISSGSTDGRSSVGGLIGYYDGSVEINNSYSTMSVLGNRAGGLIGTKNNGCALILNNSYTTGRVSGGNGNAGTVIGNTKSGANLTINNSYYLAEINPGMNWDGNNQVVSGIYAGVVGQGPFVITESPALPYDETLSDKYPFRTSTAFEVDGIEYKHIGDWPFVDTDGSGLYLNGQLVKTWKQLVEEYPEVFTPTGIISSAADMFNSSEADELRCPSNLTSIVARAFQGSQWLTKINIPEKVETIEDATFASSVLKQITLSEGLKTIKNGAFVGTSISSIDLPETLETIESSAFLQSSITSLEIPENVTKLGTSVIRDCKELTSLTLGGKLEKIPESFNPMGNNPKFTTLVIREGTKEIGNYAFDDDKTIKNVTLPSTLIDIGQLSFYNCSIDNIDLPDGLLRIGCNAFMYNNLTSFVVPESVRDFGYTNNSGNAPGGVFQYNKLEELVIGSSLYPENDLPGVTYVPSSFISYGLGHDEGKELKITLREGIKSIESSAFQNNSHITEVNLPETLESIGVNAFMYAGFEDIYLPQNLKNIDVTAFGWCSNLKTITLPDSLETLGSQAFMGTALESLTIPYNTKYKLNDYWAPSKSIDNINTICSSCQNLKSFTVENGDFVNKGGVFGMFNPLESITVLDNFEHIPDNWLATDTTNISEINLPDNVISIGSSALRHAKITSFTAPETLESMGVTPFGNNAYLERIDLSKSKLTELTTFTPEGLASLKEMILPDNLEVIGTEAFTGSYPELKSITIPASVQVIKAGNFSNCKETLEEVIFEDSTNWISEDGTDISEMVKNPDTAVEALTLSATIYRIDATEGPGIYKNGKLVMPWSMLVNKFPSSFEVEGTIKPGGMSSLNANAYDEIRLDTSIKIIDSYAFAGCSWLKHIDLAEVEEIRDSAFPGTNLEELILPETVVSMGNNNFAGLNSLKRFVASSSLEEFGSNNFTGNESLIEIDMSQSKIVTLASNFYTGGYYSNLTTIKLPQNLETIETGSMVGTMPAVTDFVIPETVEYIGNNNFSYLKSLDTFIIPDSVTYFGMGNFYNSTGIKHLVVGSGVTNIEPGMFSNLSEIESIEFRGAETLANSSISSMSNTLSEVILNDGLLSIGDGCFYGKTNIISLSIPDSVIEIGASAFSGMTDLTEISLPSELTVISNSLFNGDSSLDVIDIPDTVEYIGKNAFFGTSIYDIELPDGLVMIDDGAFADCTSLTEITIPASVKYIGKNQFESEFDSTITSVIFEDSTGWVDGDGNDVSEKLADPETAAELLNSDDVILIKDGFDAEVFVDELNSETPTLDGVDYYSEYDYNDYDYSENSSDYYEYVTNQPDSSDSRKLSVEIHDGTSAEISSMTISEYMTIEEIAEQLGVDRVEVYIGEDMISPEGIGVHSYTINGREIQTDIKLKIVGYKGE